MSTPPVNRILALPGTPEAQIRRIATMPSAPIMNKKRVREETVPIEYGRTAQTTDAVAKNTLRGERPKKRNLMGDFALLRNKEIYGTSGWSSGHCLPHNFRFAKQDPGQQGGSSPSIEV